MTLDLPSHLRRWLSRTGASRYKLVLLTGSRDARAAAEKVLQAVPGCVVLNLSLALSQRLLDISSQQRPAQAPIVLANVLAGEEPVMLHEIELLFEPTLQLDPLRALKAASRSRILFALWPGVFEGGNLTYAEPGHPEYKQYRPADLEDILVVPAADLIKEA